MGQTLREISSECPAAAIGAEARRVVAAYNIVSETENAMDELGGKPFYNTALDEMSDYLRSTVERSTYAKASSGAGALYQLAAIGYFLHDIDGAVASSDGDAGEAAIQKIRRLLHSLIDYVEATTDARLDGELEQWCMRRDTTAHTYIAQAFDIAARRLTGEK